MSSLFDPVCGMKVTGSALWAEGYDDVVFCAEYCRQAFLADPAQYLATGLDGSLGVSEGHDHEDAL